MGRVAEEASFSATAFSAGDNYYSFKGVPLVHGFFHFLNPFRISPFAYHSFIR
jgi:hypothetical protein